MGICKIRRLVAAAVVAVIMLSSTISIAQEKIAVLKEGETAQYDGFLLSPAALAELNVKAASNVALKEAEIEYRVGLAVAEWKLKYQNEKAAREFEAVAFRDRLDLRTKEIERMDKVQNGWMNRVKFPLGMTLGVALSVGMFLLHARVVDVAAGQP